MWDCPSYAAAGMWWKLCLCSASSSQRLHLIWEAGTKGKNLDRDENWGAKSLTQFGHAHFPFWDYTLLFLPEGLASGRHHPLPLGHFSFYPSSCLPQDGATGGSSHQLLGWGLTNLDIFCSCFQKISTALTKADTFLLENTLSTQSTFTLAIAAYALSLGDKSHPQFHSIVSTLKRKALVKGMPCFIHLFSKCLLSI